MAPVISNLFIISFSIQMFVISFTFTPIVKAQHLPETKENCLSLWNATDKEDNYKAYQHFLTRCGEERYANIAEIRIKVIKNRCNSAWNLYHITKERKYLEKYKDSCKEFDDEKMKQVIELLNTASIKISVLHLIKNARIDQNILITFFILVTSIFFIWREIRKDKA